VKVLWLVLRLLIEKDWHQRESGNPRYPFKKKIIYPWKFQLSKKTFSKSRDRGVYRGYNLRIKLYMSLQYYTYTYMVERFQNIAQGVITKIQSRVWVITLKNFWFVQSWPYNCPYTTWYNVVDSRYFTSHNILLIMFSFITFLLNSLYDRLSPDLSSPHLFMSREHSCPKFTHSSNQLVTHWSPLLVTTLFKAFPI